MKRCKTVEEWEESISEHKKGVFLFYRDMYNSKAFLELSKKPHHVLVLLAALNQVYYEKKDKTNKGRRVLQNGGRLYLPQNMLKTRGIKSNKTIAEAKKKIVELGFLDVEKTGSVDHEGVFSISDRWRKYPHGDYLQKDQRLPGISLYSHCGLSNPDHPVNKKRREKEKTSIQKMNVAPVQEMNVAESVSVQKVNEERPQIYH